MVFSLWQIIEYVGMRAAMDYSGISMEDSEDSEDSEDCEDGENSDGGENDEEEADLEVQAAPRVV